MLLCSSCAKCVVEILSGLSCAQFLVYMLQGGLVVHIICLNVCRGQVVKNFCVICFCFGACCGHFTVDMLSGFICA